MRCPGRAGSVAGRLRALRQRAPPAVAQCIAEGRAQTAQVKLAAQRKVAWQHASPMFVPFPRLLEQALAGGSAQRVHLVLKRILGEDRRPDVAPALLEQCADELLARLLAPRGAQWAAAAECLAQIAWRARRRSERHALWAMVRAVVHDLRGDGAQRAAYLGAVGPRDQRLVARVLDSPAVSAQMVRELHAAAGAAPALALAFYSAAMQRHPPGEIPAAIVAAMAAQRGAMEAGSGARLARTVAALAHLSIAQGDDGALGAVLSRASSLAARAQWPMEALAAAVRALVAAGRRAEAARLLQSTAAGNRREFARCLGAAPELDCAPLRAALVRDELAIRLHCHRAAEPPPPLAAFFVPTLAMRLGDPGTRQRIDEYCAEVCRIAQQAPAESAGRIAEGLATEAGTWCYRLQCAEPLAAAARGLRPLAGRMGPAEARALLGALTRALRSFGMAWLAHRKCVTDATKHRLSLQPLAAAAVEHPRARYADVLCGFDAVRRALLAEYLRRGIRPSAEELAVLQSHLAACGHGGDAWSLAAAILPRMAPEIAAGAQPGRLAVQAYYEALLHALARHEPRRLLQLFNYLMGTAAAEFRRRLVDQTVVLFLRHGHFAGFGFYRLESVFVRHVRRPWFTVSCLNHMRPRFWALHMFLRRQRYIPRVRLYGRQFYVHKNRAFMLGPSAVPQRAAESLAPADLEVVPVRGADVDAAVNIYLRSVPRTAGLGEPSTAWVLGHKTQLVRPQVPRIHSTK
ncbi:hypothetical protein H4R18_002929 [Coemansia javaensis]|uniref:Uncharacterized protein n=1 Tax=Coemansia javaensis TaxID=2761396 RepID=A0A9W8LH18_9FUNG|nr:hypothetical protein H4R18_002929 [Coemansia javaensis]